MLDEALEHVDLHFIALLVTERMQESAALLSARIGRPLAAVGTANRNPKRPSLSDIDNHAAMLTEVSRELNEALTRLGRPLAAKAERKASVAVLQEYAQVIASLASSLDAGLSRVDDPVAFFRGGRKAA